MGWETVLGLNTMQAISTACAKVGSVTLRDVFAMSALNGLLSAEPCTDSELNDLATKAYVLADSMLETRKLNSRKGD